MKHLPTPGLWLHKHLKMALMVHFNNHFGPRSLHLTWHLENRSISVTGKSSLNPKNKFFSPFPWVCWGSVCTITLEWKDLYSLVILILWEEHRFDVHPDRQRAFWCPPCRRVVKIVTSREKLSSNIFFKVISRITNYFILDFYSHSRKRMTTV